MGSGHRPSQNARWPSSRHRVPGRRGPGLCGHPTGSVPHPGREALDHPALRRCQGPRRAATLRLSRWWCCLSWGGDRAAEVSAESTVTEGSPDSGWRSRKAVSQGPTAGQGWPGNRAPVHQLRCSGRFVCWGDRVGRWRGLSPFTVLAQKEDRILSRHLTSPSRDPGDGKDHRHLPAHAPAPPRLSHQGCSSISWDPSQYI